ncbi:hypothetical protein SO802_025422 [Lithocarpus litseifolius]|uniref:Reverse transcriptase zinc-binding domain-containing protein n=1 Tax=Lithocarpus litseifolius TaxID=425828 RepID=A0AAW2BZ79_9ROSI
MLAESKVNKLMDQDRGGWNREVIEATLLPFEAEIVQKIPLCNTNQPDTLTWPFNPNGEYTVKSGYKFLQTELQNTRPGQSDGSRLNPLWQSMWSLTVPSKVRNLTWRAVPNSLPAKQNLVKRKIIQGDGCDVCHDNREDVLHALYKCPRLEALWHKVPTWNHSSLRHVTSFIDLLGCVFAENREPELFSMVIWALWTRRNTLKLGKSVGTLDQLLNQARDKLQNCAGIGVVIRNKCGQAMVSLSQRIPLPYSAVEVEALAARRGLELALETGF